MVTDGRRPLLADTSTFIAVRNSNHWDVMVGVLALPVAFLRMGTNTNS